MVDSIVRNYEHEKTEGNDFVVLDTFIECTLKLEISKLSIIYFFFLISERQNVKAKKEFCMVKLFVVCSLYFVRMYVLERGENRDH